MGERKDVYTQVTDKILVDLAKGELTWRAPWKAGHAAGPITRPLRFNGQHYRGINVLILWATALERGYIAPIYMTLLQANKLGAYVRKGEKSTLVVHADTFKKKETDRDTGEEFEKDIFFMKGYRVFNVEQIESLPSHYYTRIEQPHVTPLERDAACDAFFKNTGAVIRHGGNRAFYRITDDRVQMPELQAFRDTESYYATLAHEVCHWTRHPSRFDRDFEQKRFGDAGYAMEELVAEMGSAFLCADLGIVPETREDHAAYIASWLKALKDDKKFVFVAASHAQKVADLLHSYQAAPVRHDPAVAQSHNLPALAQGD